MVTTIQVDEKVKKQLDKLKVHNRETYNELLERLIDVYGAGDKESLIETIEVLSNPQTMRAIAQGLEEYRRGEYITLEELKKELNL